jgi:hypothetical protein
MPPLPHGAVITLDEQRAIASALVDPIKDLRVGFTAVQLVDLQDFDYLLSDLQNDPATLLPELPQTVCQLPPLGRTMRDILVASAGDPNIPAVCTDVGQFLDQDITLEMTLGSLQALLDGDFVPLASINIRAAVQNFHSMTLGIKRSLHPPDF